METKRITVDDVEFKSLYEKRLYEVETADGWVLVVTRYLPKPQSFPQPIRGAPLMLVHGFSQNRHAWSAGQLVKNLLFFGADVHVVELRGHGKSSRELQRQRAREEGRPPPPDLEWGWDLDSYFLGDLPALVQAVKRESGRDRIFWIGHSMGGMLGYGYAGLHDDLAGLVTIGAPAQLGLGFPLLKAVATAEPLLARAIGAGFQAANVGRSAQHLAGRLARSVRGLVPGASSETPAQEAPEAQRFDYVPMDEFFRLVERALSPEKIALYRRLSPVLGMLSNPARVGNDDVRWLLREGGEKEPRRVVAQFARWIRNDEMVCYRTGHDFRRSFANIRIPMAIVFGDLDPFASVDSTRAVYRQVASDYLLWRPVRGNSHIELTMGHDTRQIAYDVKNLVEYAESHRERGPTLPRAGPW